MPSSSAMLRKVNGLTSLAVTKLDVLGRMQGTEHLHGL